MDEIKPNIKDQGKRTQGSGQEFELSTQATSLLKSSTVVSIMTLLSRILGLVRDMVIANFFGASAGADAFFLAFKIPNFFRRLFGEGAFSQAFVPVLSEYQTRRSKDDIRTLVSRISGVLGLSLVILTVIGVIAAPYIMKLFAAGYVVNNETEKLALATEMLRLTFPYILLICMTAFSGSVLNSFNRFAVPAFTPVFLNISLILCAVYLTPYMETPVIALAWGVLIAGVAQLSFQMPFLARINLLTRPTLDFKDEGVRKVGKLMLPALFGVSVGQINLLLDTVLATFLETGSLSWLYYSDRLLELPLALFGITIATVILPSLSRQHAGDSTAFSKTLEWAVKMVLLVGIPASLALIVLSESLITTLFYRGEMSARDVSMASYSLSAYGIGLLGHMLVKVLAPGYFARQDTKTPVKYGIIALVSNMILNLVLIWHLRHAGLALATSLSAFINAGLLWYGLRSSGLLVLDKTWLVFLLRLAVANGIMLLCIFLISPSQNEWLSMDFWWRIMMMLFVCGFGAASYFVSLLVSGLKFRELAK